MTWELCVDSSQYLLDLWGGCDEGTSWQKAKAHFREKGYEGKFLLIARNRNGNFRLWKIEIGKGACKR